ncbi:helix-turn-helix domain-containing protein [Hymenobacter terrenus]|uniref:helix-turn-helix domain-containing protein n=1 Tax=Hymenobacter terrenus TaxID=1629124 RepID=UPI0006192B66|nr:helix-turn-helix transcriptional regulator [Hymenobacter terrenus]
MARPSNFPDSRLAVLRQYLGLPQQELADFLGISRGMLANLEANRRSMSQAVYERAAPLLALVPEGALLVVLAAPVPPPTLPTAPAPGPLEARRDYCVWRAANLRYELRALNGRANVGLRWQQALPALLAAMPPAAPDAPDLPAPDASLATRAAWVRFTYPRHLVQQWATAFTPDDAARHHLLRLQAEAFETEAAALATLLKN